MNSNSLYLMLGFDETTEEKLMSMQTSIYDKGFHGYYAKHIKNLPFHILVKVESLTNQQALVTAMLNYAKSGNAFTVEIDHVLISEEERLSLNVKASPELKALFSYFNSTLISDAQIVMLYDDKDNINAAYNILKSNFKTIIATVNRIYLYQMDALFQVLNIELYDRDILLDSSMLDLINEFSCSNKQNLALCAQKWLKHQDNLSELVSTISYINNHTDHDDKIREKYVYFLEKIRQVNF